MHGWHVAGGLAAISLIFVTTACGAGVKTEEDENQKALSEIRATYDGYLRRQPPDYVVVTLPESPSSMNQHDREVLEVIRSVLTNRKIPNEVRRLDSVLTTFVTRVRNKEYSAFRLPLAMAGSHDGATVLYINLCMSQKLETKRHPDAVKHDITVRVWNDPNTSGTAQRPVL